MLPIPRIFLWVYLYNQVPSNILSLYQVYQTYCKILATWRTHQGYGKLLEIVDIARRKIDGTRNLLLYVSSIVPMVERLRGKSREGEGRGGEGGGWFSDHSIFS